MTPSPRRTDSNQVEVMEALRAAGYMVFDAHRLGKGFPDLVVCKYRNVYLVEVKTKDGKLTPDEREFIKDGWPVVVVYDGQDALIKLHEAMAYRMEIGY